MSTRQGSTIKDPFPNPPPRTGREPVLPPSTGGVRGGVFSFAYLGCRSATTEWDSFFGSHFMEMIPLFRDRAKGKKNSPFMAVEPNK
jgi:hypothetical protein